MQNVRDYIEVKLHTNADSALKAASLPTFKHYAIIDENLVQTNHHLESITHNTPIAIGVTILELVLILIIIFIRNLSNSDTSFNYISLVTLKNPNINIFNDH